MPKPPDDTPAYVARLGLLRRSSGAVRSMAPFDRKRHSVPDAVNVHTANFLAKLCAVELADSAEELFQHVRTTLGYKRTQLSLDVTPPTAVLSAKDFTHETAYALDEADPATYVVTKHLHGLNNADLLLTDEFDSLFAGSFDVLRFDLRKPVRVEAVIDAVESLDTPEMLRVDYPSDCKACTLTVSDVTPQVHCDGVSLEMRFPRCGSPRELIEAFATVRKAFTLTKSHPLSGLL